MNDERQVTVRGAPAAIEAWLQTLSGPITEGWSRAADIERKVKGNAQLGRLHQVRQELGVPLPAPPVYAGLGLLADLQTTAEMLLDSCWALERDQACVDAAVRRVFARRRPSHKREVKDSIHLEHCLELARRIRSSSFPEQIVFASANKNDYGPAVAQQPHVELQPDFAAVRPAIPGAGALGP